MQIREQWEMPSQGDLLTNRYLYNGKEMQDDMGLGWYDYGLRFFDPQLARWHSIDPAAELMKNWSPFNYCFGNPVRFEDKDGAVPVETIWDVGNVLYDIGSGIYHEIAGNREEANSAWGDLAMDAAAMLIPYVPAGASKIVKGAKAVDKAVDAVKAADNATDAAKVVDKGTDATKAVDRATDESVALKEIGPAGDAGGTIMKQLPENMQSNMKTTKKGQGTIFKDPNNPSGNNVRVQNGNPNSPNSAQQKPYVKQVKDGKTIDVNGNQVDPKSAESHIPKEEFKYN